QHGLAAKVRKLHLPAIQCGQLEIGRWHVMNISDQLDGTVFPGPVKILASSQHTHDDRHKHYENEGIAFQQEVPLEREPVQERQIAGKQFQVIEKYQYTDCNQEYTADYFNGVQMTAKPAIERQEAVHPQRRQQKRHGQPKGIDRQKYNALEHRFLRSRENQDGSQYRTDARRPSEGEGEAHGK